MPDDTKPRADNNGDLAYWMGKVDTQLVTMNQTLVTLTANDRSNWRDFNSWRDEVDKRLQVGSANFERLDATILSQQKTIAEIQKSYADIMDSLRGCQAQRDANLKVTEARERAEKLTENHKVNDSKLDKPINDGDSITYRWLLEKIAMPVGIAFILWLLLTLLPEIIQHIQ